MTTALTHKEVKPSKRRKLRLWIHWLVLALVIISPLIFLVAALGYKFGFWDLGFAFGTLTRKIGPLMLMATMGAGAVGLILGFLIKPRKGIVISLIAIAVPLAGILHAKSVSKTVQSLPFIHDITTDTQDPPMFTAAILTERAKTDGVNPVDYVEKRDRPDGELVSVLQVAGYPDIRPLILSDAPDVVFGRAKAAVKSLGWKMVSEDTSAGLIEATEKTFWYGFSDDVIIRIRAANGGGSVVDVRSVSRVGKSDIGANAARIRKFIKTMQQ